MAQEKMGVKVTENPSEFELERLGVFSWPTWTSANSPKEFPWTFKENETMFLTKGKVNVFPDSLKEEFFEIGGGDLAIFPEGLSCYWEILEPVEKHYHLG